MSPTRCAHNGRSGASRFTNGGEGGLATSIRLQTKMQINQLNSYLSIIPDKMYMLKRQALRENLHKSRQLTRTAMLGSLHDHYMIYHARSHHLSTGHSCIVLNLCLEISFCREGWNGFQKHWACGSSPQCRGMHRTLPSACNRLCGTPDVLSHRGFRTSTVSREAGRADLCPPVRTPSWGA